VLENVDTQHKVEAAIGDCGNVVAEEVESLVFVLPGEADSFGRDVVPFKDCVRTERRLKLLQNRPRATSNIHHARRVQSVLLQHRADVPGFPGRVFDVEAGLLPRVFPAGIHVRHGASLGDSPPNTPDAPRF